MLLCRHRKKGELEDEKAKGKTFMIALLCEDGKMAYNEAI